MSPRRFAWLLCLLATMLAPCPPSLAEAPPHTKIVVIGDSTVSEYPLESTSRGWGHYLASYFQPSVLVVNLAMPGRSTKTFIAEGRWAQALVEKPRFVLIQFGHNDSHAPERPEAVSVPQYQEFLRRYVAEARAIQAEPVLITPMVRRRFLEGRVLDELLPYAEAMQAVAAELKVPLVDLHASSLRLVSEMGDEASMRAHANEPTDRTHFSAAGAQAMAALIMQELPAAVPALRPLLK